VPDVLVEVCVVQTVDVEVDVVIGLLVTVVENELVIVVEALTTLGVLVTVTILSGAVNKLVMVVVGVWVK